MASLVKRLSAAAGQSRTFARLVDLLERRQDRRENLLRVLTYHRVARVEECPHLCPGLVSATPAAFEEQMRYVARRCRPVSLDEVLSAVRGQSPLPPRAVLITFDDAYRDFLEHAWPVLRRYELPAVMFVATAFPGHARRAFWWDRLYQALSETPRRDELRVPLGRLPLASAAERSRAFDRLKGFVKSLPHDAAMALVERVCAELDAPPATSHVMTWPELRSLAAEGLALGAHTCTHPLMNRVSVAEARAEALASLDELRRQVGASPAVFAYPSGGFDRQVVVTLREAGFELAFTTGRGINDLRVADPLRLRRINVGRRTSLSLLRAQMLPWSAPLNGWKR